MLMLLKYKNLVIYGACALTIIYLYVNKLLLEGNITDLQHNVKELEVALALSQETVASYKEHAASISSSYTKLQQRYAKSQATLQNLESYKHHYSSLMQQPQAQFTNPDGSISSMSEFTPNKHTKFYFNNDLVRIINHDILEQDGK